MRCIIPARGGSTRIPGKNMKVFLGQPIIQYSINHAKAVGLFQEIIVSTDDTDTAAYAARQGCVVHYRGETFAADDVGTQIVAANVITDMGIQPGEVICVLYATSPLLDIDYLRQGMYELHHNPNIKYTYSTGMDGVDAGNFYWGDAESFLKQIPLEGNSEHIAMQPNRVCDINTQADWDFALKMYEDLRNANA